MAGQNDLEVEEDRRFQERFWRFERFAWVLMALLVIAALAGATGSGGPLAEGRAEARAGTITYPRIARWQAAAELTVRLPPLAAGPTEFELADSFTRIFAVESIEPAPSASTATGASHRFTFDLASGGGEKTIVFHLRAARPALPRRTRAQLGDAPPVDLQFVVLP